MLWIVFDLQSYISAEEKKNISTVQWIKSRQNSLFKILHGIRRRGRPFFLTSLWAASFWYSFSRILVSYQFIIISFAPVLFLVGYQNRFWALLFPSNPLQCRNGPYMGSMCSFLEKILNLPTKSASWYLGDVQVTALEVRVSSHWLSIVMNIVMAIFIVLHHLKVETKLCTVTIYFIEKRKMSP